MQNQFSNQVRRVRFMTSNVGGRKFLQQKDSLNINKLIKNREYDAVLNSFVRTKRLNNLQDAAYKSKRGYALGVVNGKKVMYVSGSRNITDWAFNVIDDILPSKRQYFSNHTAKRLTAIAKKNNIDVVVGHSRGGMLVAKMDIPNHKKLSLDGAMRLAPTNRRNVMNLYQKQALDKFISRRGTNRKGYKMNRWKNYHFISRDRRVTRKRKTTYRRRYRPYATKRRRVSYTQTLKRGRARY